MTTVGVAIVSWPEFEDNASHILSEVLEHGDVIHVLHNGPLPIRRGNPDSWIEFPPEAYFGGKFLWALENIDTDVLLLIVADTWTERWRDVVEECRNAFSADADIAVWAPIVDETWWNTEKIVINSNHQCSDLDNVVAVDSIVWAVSSQLLAEMRKLDFSVSRFGWGIEVASAAIARCNGKLVVRSRRLEVAHRRGTSYSKELANEEAQLFFQQLEPSYRVMVSILEEFALLKTVITPNTLSRRVRRTWGKLRDTLYRVTVRPLLRR